MRRAIRAGAATLATVLLSILAVVVVPTAAHASGCTLPPCGAFANHTSQSITVRWSNDNDGWTYATVAPGQTKGGWTNDGIDVDFFLVPTGCVAIGTVPTDGSFTYYGPAGWDKIASTETVSISSISCRDGYVYAWADAADVWSAASQGWAACRWYYNDANWGDNCGGFRNIASTLQNNSSAGNSVNFYYSPSYGGAWACLSAGDVWRNLAAGKIFSWGSGLGGYWQSINDDIASSKFVSTCGVS